MDAATVLRDIIDDGFLSETNVHRALAVLDPLSNSSMRIEGEAVNNISVVSIASGEPARYRLLTVEDVIQIGDELLGRDAETWNAEYYSSSGDGRHVIGCPWGPGLVPHRRRIDVETNQI